MSFYPRDLGFFLAPRMRVGLYGGSFDPAHEGHRHVAEHARRQLGLDKVIWMVSPQNPLKRGKGGPSMSIEKRMERARRIAKGPSMVVSDVEAQLGSPYTIDTVRFFQTRFPGVRFFWIMGSDSLSKFHRWKDWRAIAALIPIAIVYRPHHLARARLSPAGRAIPVIEVHAPLNAASSTDIRLRAKLGFS